MNLVHSPLIGGLFVTFGTARKGLGDYYYYYLGGSWPSSIFGRDYRPNSDKNI